MLIETQRLILRDWHPTQDARHAMDIFGDSRVMGPIDSRKDDSIRQVQGRLQRYRDKAQKEEDGTRSWAVEQKEIGRVIGHVILTALPDIRQVRLQQAANLPVADYVEHEMEHEVEHEAAYDSEHEQADAVQPVSTTNPDGMPTDYIEIGWHFRPASWGFGYATEAAFSVAQYAFETLKLPVLLAVSAPENQLSVAVMNSIGMQCNGITTRYYRGAELMLYELSPDAFFETKARWDSDRLFLEALNKIEQQA
ncbi:MAG: GNAT family N-acetyltransferase [Cyanobacteria bacterium P01_A01_bin.116]